MTRRELSRRFIPSISYDPYFSIRPLLQSFRDLDRMMQLSNTAVTADGTPVEDKQLVYHDVSPEQEEFSVWTRGVYPKLNIFKVLDEEKALKSLRIVAAVPGLSKEQVSVNILGGEVAIESGIKQGEEEATPNEEMHSLVQEIPSRYSKVVVGVTGPFNFDEATADFPGDGTIVVDIPAKAIEKEKPRKLFGK